jgi:uncharacterized membrane protein YciS (DUF1049 family)
VILLLLLAIFALTGAFAAENEGTQVFQLLGYTRTLPTWAPTVVGVGAGAALITLVVCAGRLRSQLRAIRHERAVHRHLRVIERLEADNARLREELAAARSAYLGATVPCCDEQGWLHPPTLPGPRSVPSSPPIARPLA